MMPEAIEKLGFLLGEWRLDYNIPKSSFAEAGTDVGTGKFRRALNDNYVIFEYSTETGGAAQGIFAWDTKAGVLRYWWFENSGSFVAADCQFLSDDVLAMNWHDTVLVQTFTKAGPDIVVLKMRNPTSQGTYELVLEVVLTKKR